MSGSGGGELSRDGLREVIRGTLGLGGGFGIERAPAGKFNDTFFVDGAELDRALVVRVAPPDDRSRMLFYEHRMMRQEPGIHRILRKKTSMPAPEILHFERDNRVLGRDFLIMERLPGAPAGGMAGGDGVMRELGAKLREVHDRVRAEPGRYGYLGEHEPMEAQGSWREAFRVMWHALLDDIERCQGAEGGEIESWRAALEERLGMFEHFDETASLLHMDVWAENILCASDGGGAERLTGLVDWDRALWGDPEIEYAVLDYCGISVPPFWKGYGRDRLMDHEAQVRRVFYLLYEVLKYIVIRIARQGNRAGAARYHAMARELMAQL